MVRQTHRAETGRRRRMGAHSGLLALGLSFGLVGCSDLLDVENPNNIKQDDVNDPIAAEAVVNGALAVLTEAVNAVMAPYAAATDEVSWIGSRDAWGQIDDGRIEDPNNEFTDTAFPALAQARWFADEAIRLLEEHRANDDLDDPILLARAYMYSAIAYITIADMFEDFAFSDRTEAGQPVGEENMGSLYTMAIEKLDAGRQIALAEGDSDLALTMLALRARAHHAQAVWDMLNPAGAAPGDPLVDNAAATDAAAVIAALGAASDWRFQLTNDNQVSDIAYVGEVSLAYNLNSRGELQFGSSIVFINADDKTEIDGIQLQDPIDQVADPVIAAAIDEFVTGFLYSPYTMVSAREMHLILAESELAKGNTPGFATHINHVRAMDGLTAFDPNDDAHPDDVTMLAHERQVNLFLQGRRLADLYRFDIQPAEWAANSTAATKPGAVFPVTGTELRSNCNFPNNQC